MVELAKKKLRKKKPVSTQNEFSLQSHNCHAVVCIVDKSSNDTDFFVSALLVRITEMNITARTNAKAPVPAKLSYDLGDAVTFAWISVTHVSEMLTT